MLFKGTGTAIITPFTQGNDIDYAAFKKILSFQINNGVDAIILLGTTGESPVISMEERKRLLDLTIGEVNGKAKVVVGTGTNDTKKVVEVNKIVEEYKADALLIVNPYYNKGTQASLVEHYKYISERARLPIVLYNVPSRTGMNLLPETIVKIHSECKNVIGVKEACGNISQIARLFSIKPASLAVYSGNDNNTFSIMTLGGEGVVSVFSNAYPKEMKQLTNALLNNDLDTARKLNNKYQKMMNLLFVETSPSPIKFVMSKLGMCENILRLPLLPVTEQTEKLLTEEMNKF
jgi:4-hydroxy-tetrahydrodipicolinate synthase